MSKLKIWHLKTHKTVVTTHNLAVVMILTEPPTPDSPQRGRGRRQVQVGGQPAGGRGRGRAVLQHQMAIEATTTQTQPISCLHSIQDVFQGLN